MSPDYVVDLLVRDQNVLYLSCVRNGLPAFGKPVEDFAAIANRLKLMFDLAPETRFGISAQYARFSVAYAKSPQISVMLLAYKHGDWLEYVNRALIELSLASTQETYKLSARLISSWAETLKPVVGPMARAWVINNLQKKGLSPDSSLDDLGLESVFQALVSQLPNDQRSVVEVQLKETLMRGELV
jgi:hypothetical protein